MSAAMLPQVALLTGDRIDCTLELFMRLRPAQIAEVADAPAVLPPLSVALPRAGSGPVVLLGSAWVTAARARGVDVVGSVLPWLRNYFDRVVGLDQEASFQLEFPDDVAAGLDAIIKPNGVYRDASLYAWEVGAWTSDGAWTERRQPRAGARPDCARLPVHRGVPGFITEAPAMRALRRARLNAFSRTGRAAMDRWFAGATRSMSLRHAPRATAHFLGSLTHVQRAEAVRRIRHAKISFVGGITDVHARVNGFGARWRELEAVERASWQRELLADGLAAPRLSRWAYRRSLQSAKAVVSLVGHGEVCYRMAEAWAARRVLVCQDLSHADIGFPLVAGRNVVFCRPDLDDLTAVLEDIECNFHRYLPIAEQGHTDWLEWASGAEERLLTQFQPLWSQPSVMTHAAG